MSIINDVLSMLLLRSRKKHWRVGYSQQWYTQTDLRIRFITDIWFYPEMLKGDILQEEVYTKHADYICTRYYDASKFYDDFDSYKDVYTLNIDELKELYDEYMRKRFKRKATY